jgi:Outer membrane protein
VTLSQTVWSFQSYRQLREADAQVAAAENTYLQAQQTLIFNVAQAYFNVLSAADTVRADRAQLKANQALLDQAQHEYKAGLVAITNVQTAQASYDSTRATLVGDRAALANAKQSLAVLTGDYRPQVQPLLDNIPLVRPDPASPDAWVAAARKDNFDLRGAQLTYEIANRNIAVQRSQYYPSLQIQGSASDSASGGQLGSHTRDYAIGLALNVPIFQGGLVQSQVRQAKATALEDLANLQGNQRSIAAQVRNAYDNVVAGVSSVRSFRAAVASNRTALKATEMGLKVGTQTEIDVLTALNNLFTAQRQFYQARYTYLENLLTLKQLAGRLDVGDLRAIDALLMENRGLTAPDPQMKVPIEHRVKPLGSSGGGGTK